MPGAIVSSELADTLGDAQRTALTSTTTRMSSLGNSKRKAFFIARRGATTSNRGILSPLHFQDNGQLRKKPRRFHEISWQVATAKRKRRRLTLAVFLGSGLIARCSNVCLSFSSRSSRPSLDPQ